MDVEKVKAGLRKKKKEMKLSNSDFVSSGSTLVNLAATGHPDHCFAKGHYTFYVGDSASGKTWLALSALAEAANSKRFKDYHLVYDNGEDGALMDMETFFGKRLVNRLEVEHSTTVEEFYYTLDDLLETGEPFIYVLDSMDVLTSEAQREKFEENKEATRKGKEIIGSYGDGKAKINSTHLRLVLPRLKETGSILLIINQTRDNLGFGFNKKTRSGGHALRFYAHLELWTSIKRKLKRTVRGTQREVGVEIKVRIEKNRYTGRLREVVIPIYHSYGIDDIGSCVDYLVAEKHWKKKGANIRADDFDMSGSRESIIAAIEEEGLEKDLRHLVWEVWSSIEEACHIKRKPRYV